MGEEHRKSSTFVILKSLMKTIKGSTCKGDQFNQWFGIDT